MASYHRILTCGNDISRTVEQRQKEAKLSGKMTYSNGSPPPWVVDPNVGASSFQGIYSIVTVLPGLIQTVCHGFSVPRGLRKIPSFLGGSKNAVTREALNAACIRRFERVWRVQIPISVDAIDVIAVCGES